MLSYTPKDIARFWSKVRVGSPRKCWRWTAGRHYDGYGSFKAQGKTLGSHRVAYELLRGAIPAGLGVLHSCDNRACCNPFHLFLGTALDNNADRDRKGRQARGERSGTRKLTWPEVRKMRWRWAQGNVTQKTLAQEFFVSTTTVGCILRFKSWRQN